MAEAKKASVLAYVFKSAMVRGMMLGVILFASVRDLLVRWRGVDASVKIVAADIVTRANDWLTVPVAVVWLLLIAWNVRADYLASKEGDA